MKKIIAFAGSNSKNSINKTLAAYAANTLVNDSVTVLDLNDFNVPMYGIDFENEFGIPEAAITFLEYLKHSDGIIVSLAEHNGAYTSVFKNLFDWMSRVEAKVFFDKPMLLMATSPGGRGGQSVLELAVSSFPRHGANVVATYSLPSFYDNFVEGKINQPELENQLTQEVERFKASL